MGTDVDCRLSPSPRSTGAREFLVAGLIFACVQFAHAQTAIPLTGEPFTAEFAGLDAQQNIKLKVGDRLRVLPAAELVRWGAWKELENGPQIVLATGGSVRADVLSLNETNLLIGDASDLGSVLWDESTLPVESICGLVWQPPADALARDRLRLKLLSLPAGKDQLLLTAGETLQGTIIGVPPAGRFTEKLTKEELAAADVFTLQVPKIEKPLVIAASKVLAVRFGAAEVQQPTAPTSFARVGFRDGSWLSAAKIATARDTFTVSLPGGGQLVANNAYGDGATDWFWKQVTLLQPFGDRVVYVSDLPPLGFKHLPFLSGQWNYGRDQNVLGGYLRTRDQVYLKGLGMFPASRLAYDLGGKYRRLEGSLALDARAEQKGSVTFRVLLEGAASEWTAAYESPVIRGGDSPVELSIDVKNAQRLAILVDFADRGDQCDYANWLDLRLLK